MRNRSRTEPDCTLVVVAEVYWLAHYKLKLTNVHFTSFQFKLQLQQLKYIGKRSYSKFESHG